MNNILTYSDFTIDISLPIDKTSIDILNSYITKYQEEYLINLLGYTLYKEFITKDNINDLFKKYNVPNKFDVLSIDIDYNDLWVWKNMVYRI